MVVHHWVIVDSVVMDVYPRIEMNTVDEGCSFLAMNPSVQMNLWAVIKHPHMREVNLVNTDMGEPLMVVHHWVVLDSVVMEMYPRMEMNTVDVDEGCSFMVVNPSVQMNHLAVIMHPHMG
jgi:uncharacterized protein YqjF (DUF2071 family)